MRQFHTEEVWYIDTLDTMALNESFASKPDRALFDAIIRTAAVLAKYGVTSSGMLCIELDKENRIVTVRQAKTKY